MFLFAFLKFDYLNFHKHLTDIAFKYVCIAIDLYIHLYLYDFDLSSFSFCFINIDNIADANQSLILMKNFLAFFLSLFYSQSLFDA